MDLTRSLYILDTILAGWAGVGAYLYEAGTDATTLVTGYPYTGMPYNFFEVSRVPEQGSWWLPVVPAEEAPHAWADPHYGGVSDLTATGAITTQTGGQPIVRPLKLYWWVPSTTLASAPYVPAGSAGTVLGSFPSKAPGGDSTKYTVKDLMNGVEIALQSPGWTARIAGNTVKVVWDDARAGGVPTPG